MPNAAIVPHVEPQAVVPKSQPPKTFLLPFGKTLYTVPESAFMSFPKRCNVMSSGEALGQLLATKAPEKWMDYCHPDTLCRIKGDDGSNCVYTTFSVEGAPDEKRFLRFVSATVAEKNFEAKKKVLADEIAAISNERQQIRYDVLDWKKLVDCPNRAQLSPEIEKWVPVTGSDVIKSVAVAPESKKRTKPGQASSNEIEAMTNTHIEFQKFIKKPRNTLCKITETDDIVHVVFYKKHADEDENDI